MPSPLRWRYDLLSFSATSCLRSGADAPRPEISYLLPVPVVCSPGLSLSHGTIVCVMEPASIFYRLLSAGRHTLPAIRNCNLCLGSDALVRNPISVAGARYLLPRAYISLNRLSAFESLIYRLESVARLLCTFSAVHDSAGASNVVGVRTIASCVFYRHFPSLLLPTLRDLNILTRHLAFGSEIKKQQLKKGCCMNATVFVG